MYEGKIFEFPYTQQKYIRFIRAAFNRSAYITTNDEVYIWGENIDNSKHLESPLFLFKSLTTIRNLKFGKKHGLFLA